MTAGLPGLGISGFFYICLVLLMPLRELWMTVRGRTTAQRWKQVGFQWTMAFLMTVAVYVEVLTIRAGLKWLAAGSSDWSFWLWTKISYRPLLPQVLWATLISLSLILAVYFGTYLAFMAQKAGLIGQTVGEVAVHRD